MVAAGAQAIVMDDGFQNPTIAKDLSLIIVDGPSGLGNSHVVPSGPLRETVATGMDRANAVVIIGDDRHGLAPRLASWSRPILRARLEPTAAAAWLRDESVVAFAGIGRPAKFFETLDGLGARMVARFDYPDHHWYDGDDIMQMADLARGADAVLVTTAKDYARLPEPAREIVHLVPVGVTWDDESSIDALLADVVARGSGATPTPS